MKQKSSIVFVFLIGISLLIISLDLTEKVESLKIFAQYLLAPNPELALRIIDRNKYLSENFISFVKIHQENQFLKQEINNLCLIKSQYECLLKENDSITNAMGLANKSKYSLLTARVISRDPSDWYKDIIINKGRNSGIQTDMSVVIFENEKMNLIGRVAEVRKNTSKILLLTDPISYVPVKTYRSQETGLVKGQESAELIFNYLMPDSDVKIGDKVISSGIGEVFPEGLPIGLVTSIPKQDNVYYKKVLVKPLISWNKINIIYLIKK
ncbi:MAG: rod shape-determining protein MreC [Elusimicrobia bacterium RIFOXYA2_FULL_39_19]|nr:MAG: rod shape-determining protein MreC [Elusimicrobia bacterium RIFOXYA2_FULL_39_19]